MNYSSTVIGSVSRKLSSFFFSFFIVTQVFSRFLTPLGPNNSLIVVFFLIKIFGNDGLTANNEGISCTLSKPFFSQLFSFDLSVISRERDEPIFLAYFEKGLLTFAFIPPLI